MASILTLSLYTFFGLIIRSRIGSDKKEENFPEETEEINEEEVEEALELVTETCQKNSSDNEEENQEENIDDNDEMLPNLVVDGQEIPGRFLKKD